MSGHRAVGVVVIGVCLLCGCTGGRLSLRSTQEGGQVLVGNFSQSLYGYDDRNTLHVLLVEGKAQDPTQVVHVEMHWVPRAGRTPIDPRATNAVIRYIVFTGEGAGVYGGAGYLFPQNNPGGKTLRADVRGSSLRLEDSSPGFADRLGLSVATGGFTARRDDIGALRLLRQVRVRLHERLGYPQLIMGPTE